MVLGYKNAVFIYNNLSLLNKCLNISSKNQNIYWAKQPANTLNGIEICGIYTE